MYRCMCMYIYIYMYIHIIYGVVRALESGQDLFCYYVLVYVFDMSPPLYWFLYMLSVLFMLLVEFVIFVLESR